MEALLQALNTQHYSSSSGGKQFLPIAYLAWHFSWLI